MAVVHRDWRTDGLNVSRLSKEETRVLSDVIELAMSSQAFADELIKQIGKLVQLNRGLRVDLKKQLKGGKRGQQPMTVFEALSLLAEVHHAREELLQERDAEAARGRRVYKAGKPERPAENALVAEAKRRVAEGRGVPESTFEKQYKNAKELCPTARTTSIRFRR